MIHSLREWEEKCFVCADRYIPRYSPHLRKRARLLRYLAAGTTAAIVDFGLLYLFTEKVGLHYLTSAILAFIVAFIVSFLLQKFWTFQDDSVDRVHAQAAFYLVIALLNLLLNTGLLYVFVDILHLWYMTGQFITSGLIAFESFFISRHFIFKRSSPLKEYAPAYRHPRD